MSEIRCERCLAGARRNLDTGLRCDAERAWRWQIACINDDEAAEQQVEREIGDCISCWKGFSRYLGGVLKSVMIGRVGKENALAIAGRYLDEALNAPSLEDLLNQPGTEGEADGETGP